MTKQPFAEEINMNTKKLVIKTTGKQIQRDFKDFEVAPPITIPSSGKVEWFGENWPNAFCMGLLPKGISGP